MRVGSEAGTLRRGIQARGVLAALTAGLLASACAGAPSILSGTEEAKPQVSAAPVTGVDELHKATEYWRNAYMKSPRDAKAALNYARNLKALGQKQQAMQVLQQAVVANETNRDIKSEYGRLALEFDQISLAKKLLAAADDPANPDWRVISARGTVLAKEGQFAASIPFYERALAMAPNQSSVLNNLALAHLMNGDPGKAEEFLQQAVAKGGPNAGKLQQNLSLALGLQGKHIESQSIASNVQGTAQAEANAKYLKKLLALDPPQTANAPEAGRAPVVRTTARSRPSDQGVALKPTAF